MLSRMAAGSSTYGTYFKLAQFFSVDLGDRITQNEYFRGGVPTSAVYVRISISSVNLGASLARTMIAMCAGSESM